MSSYDIDFPQFDALSDEDLIGLLSWTEKWSPKRVYDVAHSTLDIEFNTFEEWCEGDFRLHRLARLELIRACKKNFALGKMWRLKWFARIHQVVRILSKQFILAFIAFSVAYLLMG